MTNTTATHERKPSTTKETQDSIEFSFRMTIASALLRHTKDDSAHVYVAVHRGTSSITESGVIISERICLLPLTMDIGILQSRSRMYYPMNVSSFHGQALRNGILGYVEDLTELFDRA